MSRPTVRPWWIVTAVVVMAAVIVSVVALVAAQGARPSPSEPERQRVLAAARDGFGAVMSYDPRHAAADRATAQQHLTGLLAAEYRASGPDVVIPGIVQAGATLRAEVIGVGVSSYSGAEARVLAFVNQSVTWPTIEGNAPSRGPDSRLDTSPVAQSRWLRMRDVDGRWLIADLRSVEETAG